MSRVLSVGAATQDVFLEGDVLTPVDEHGQHFIELRLGDKLYLDQATFSTGGNACNGAVTFARQGMAVDFVGAVGDDPIGLAVKSVLSQEGVGLDYLSLVPDARTGYSVILLAPDGSRTILRIKGETEVDLDHSHVLAKLADYDWLYLSSIGSLALTKQVLEAAAKHQLKVAFNPGTLDLKQPDQLKPLLAHVSLLVLNKEETQLLFEGDSKEALAQAAASAQRVAVVSDGPAGVAVCDGRQLYTAGMYQDVPVVDRTGAGDAFASGFAATLASGGSITDCITFASANSTSVVGQIGAKAGILSAKAELHQMPIEISPITKDGSESKP